MVAWRGRPHVLIGVLLQADVSSHATLLGSEVDSGLSARCAEALFEAAAADPSLTSARLHVSFVEVTESAVYDIMASNPQQRGGRQDQREPWIEIDPASDNIGAPSCLRSSCLYQVGTAPACDSITTHCRSTTVCMHAPPATSGSTSNLDYITVASCSQYGGLCGLHMQN